jgi:hypothetical protein
MNRFNSTVLLRIGSAPARDNRWLVFILPDSTANRLDIATAAADGSFVHLVAVGVHAPRFEFAAL